VRVIYTLPISIQTNWYKKPLERRFLYFKIICK
jgi:hypothetical protein